MGAELGYWRGRESADELVEGAMRKWKKERKQGAEKMGWTVVLENADGEMSTTLNGAEAGLDGDDDWELLATL